MPAKVNPQEALELLTNPSYGGGVRANRFAIELSNFRNIDQNRQFQVVSVDVPSLTVGTVDYQYNTFPIIKVPYARLPAQTITVNFRVDRTGTLLRQLNLYMEELVKPSLGYTSVYLDEMLGQFNFISYSIANNLEQFRFEFYRALITEIGTVNYAHEDRDSYVTQSLTFTYQDFEYKQGKQSP
jgi:hypothetical protein